MVTWGKHESRKMDFLGWSNAHCLLQAACCKLIQSPLTNGRRFIDGDVSLGDILPNLLSEIYALVKKRNYRKYIDRILYISLVKITPIVCKKSWKLKKKTCQHFTKSK